MNTNAILELLKESDYPITKRKIAKILNYGETQVEEELKTLLDKKEIISDKASRPIKYGIKKTVSEHKRDLHVSNFKNITDIDALLAYLCNNARLKNTSVLCQYTSLKAAIGIISNRCWYLGSPKNMNDGLELQQGLDTRDDIFFSSFMVEQKESIAMWSMYAQPWEDGVMISIPVNEFKQWIKDIEIIYSADPETKKRDWNTFVYLNQANVSVTRVAYIKRNMEGGIEKLICGGAKNELLQSIDDPALIGYIKEDAWSYEKEVRLRVDLGKGVNDKEDNYKGVAIDIPEYVIDSITITKGPRFSGDLMERLKEAYIREIKTESSFFYDKLKYTPCDGCTYRDSK